MLTHWVDEYCIESDSCDALVSLSSKNNTGASILCPLGKKYNWRDQCEKLKTESGGMDYYLFKYFLF